ncbi:MAG: universal stress protein [Nitrososphaeraceae archaeon]
MIEKQHDQNGLAQIKSEHNLSSHREAMWKQKQFLQSTPKFTRILVPYEKSQISDSALRYAIYLSKISSSDIFILSIVENYEELKEMLPVTIRVEKEEDTLRSNKNDLRASDLKISVEGSLRKTIEEMICLCKEAGVNTNVTYEIRTGKPSDEIIKVAEMTGFDLIVMGSHRITSTIKNIGSTTRKVLDTLKKPVLLIHE